MPSPILSPEAHEIEAVERRIEEKTRWLRDPETVEFVMSIFRDRPDRPKAAVQQPVRSWLGRIREWLNATE